ncbi:hypothetical protein K7X08_001019 [Anisodus acutangulus]|uniref:Uncharacterized protein n=1 Tax=Anisodus acutangulus TaxID=402998 RepID=A0A9Q1RML8_9SOLA|nr:hypothetical protein K7X08_001019 [Anisodus acutangulus]
MMVFSSGKVVGSVDDAHKWQVQQGKKNKKGNGDRKKQSMVHGNNTGNTTVAIRNPNPNFINQYAALGEGEGDEVVEIGRDHGTVVVVHEDHKNVDNAKIKGVHDLYAIVEKDAQQLHGTDAHVNSEVNKSVVIVNSDEQLHANMVHGTVRDVGNGSVVGDDLNALGGQLVEIAGPTTVNNGEKYLNTNAKVYTPGDDVEFISTHVQMAVDSGNHAASGLGNYDVPPSPNILIHEQHRSNNLKIATEAKRSAKKNTSMANKPSGKDVTNTQDGQKENKNNSECEK